LQREESVIHVVADRLDDMITRLNTLRERTGDDDPLRDAGRLWTCPNECRAMTPATSSSPAGTSVSPEVMDGMAPTPPKCPITGLPARRHLQTVSSRALKFMWRVGFGIRRVRELEGISRFELWESPCGLAFFDPMIAGDKDFYADCYRRLGERGAWTRRPVERSDYRRVAGLIHPGQSLLDVGCGPAGLARYVPHARYRGLDQSAVAPLANVCDESLLDHAKIHSGEYDAVCSFHVVEHVADPVSFVSDMVRCLRPAGKLFLAVPSWPSAITAIPNFALNGPPHHLTWWTLEALKALTETLGLELEAIEYLPPSPEYSLIYWMGWAAPKLRDDRYFHHAKATYFGLLWCWLVGRACNFLFHMPPGTKSFELLLIARKPGYHDSHQFTDSAGWPQPERAA
jgi:SAM-dependent methyltransferase